MLLHFFVFSLINSDYSSASQFKSKKIEITKRTPPPDSDGKVYVTNNLKTRKPVEDFDCKDTVYVLVSDITKKGSHILEVYWIPPSSKMNREYTKVVFTVEEIPMDVYAQLKLNAGLVNKLLSGMDPSAGMEKVIGKWKVNIHMDEKLMEQKFFFLAC